MDVSKNDRFAARGAKRVPGPVEQLAPERLGGYRIRLERNLLIERNVQGLQAGDLSNLLNKSGYVQGLGAFGSQKEVGQRRAQCKKKNGWHAESNNSNHLLSLARSPAR